ncbi:hypothetical protein ACTWJ8_23920 [Streptomyces sp. SDT5-1]|uniref:hypothetical protein n=1 Tax=Streptomyces sp. SDT5-1 TaxID=3406418 RepID=UPI003FD4F127
MADEHDKWLNRDAADRLLRGEPPAVPGDAARQADRMAAALHALADVPAGPDGELPGEEAALKAFREARTVTAANTAVNGAAAGTTHALRPVRPKRRTAGSGQRWGRPARFGVVAAFAACMVGGVAVAAGTGVLPSPFRGSDDPAPAASVSAAASPDRPLASASAGVEEDGHAVPSPTRSPSATGSPSHSQDTPREGRTSKDEGPKATVPGGADARAEARRLVDTCRKYRGGELGSEDVQRLESSAKSLGQSPRSLGRFCDRVLARESAPTTSADKTASHHEGDSGSSGDGGGSYGQSGGGKGKGADDDEESDAVGSASADGSLPSASVSISPSPTPDVGASPDADPSVSTSTSPTPTP